jgi:hypothetical protein
MRRWLFRILLGIVILIAVILIATQVILWTDLPRKLVLSQVQQELGLRVEAKSLSTGWLGHTTLKDVHLSLPLAEDSFLQVPVMHVDHTGLIRLVLTQHLDLKGIEIDKPTLFVRRDAQGRWNIQDAAELLIKSTTGTPEPGTRKKPPRLPSVQLTDGTIVIIDRSGKRSTIEPLTIKGSPAGPLVYQYDAEVPQHIKVVGQVAPGEDFKHEFSFFAKPEPAWLTPFMSNPPSPLLFNGQWAGVVRGETVIGRVILQEAEALQFGARGRVALEIAAGAGSGNTNVNAGDVIAHPQGLVITTGNKLAPQLEIASGTINAAGPTHLSAQGLRVQVMGGTAELNGTADLIARTAQLNGQWHDLSAPMKVRHGGNVTVSITNPFPGHPRVSGIMQTNGEFPQGTWTGQVRFDASGPDWTHMDAALTVPQLAWDGRAHGQVQNLTARLSRRGPVITLQGVDWPGHFISASAEFDGRGQRSWFARVHGREYLHAPLDYSLDASGEGGRATLKGFSVRDPRGLTLLASGSYDSHLPKPVALRVDVSHEPAPDDGKRLASIQGHLSGQAEIQGTINPVLLDVSGHLYARRFKALGRDIGNMDAVLEGNITRDFATFDMHDLNLLGGSWQAKGVWPYDRDDKLTSEVPLRVKLTVDGLALKEAGQLLKSPQLEGTAKGVWTIDIPLPGPKLNDIAVLGHLQADDIAWSDRFHADRLNADIELRQGILRADPVVLHENHNGVSGVASLTINTSLSQLLRPTVLLDARNWPIEVSRAGSASISAQANLAIDARNLSANGPISARAQVATTRSSIGELAIDGRIAGRTIDLNQIAFDGSATAPATTENAMTAPAEGERSSTGPAAPTASTQPSRLTGIGGHAEGRATIDLDAPNKATAAISWSDLDGRRLAELVPALHGLEGIYAGALTLDPATQDRALEPLRLTLGMNPTDGRFRTVDIGAIRLSAFLDLTRRFALDRVVLAQLPSEERADEKRETELDQKKVPLEQRPLGWNELRLAGGRVKLWGRRGRHSIPRASAQVTSHVIASFDQLNIQQLLHAAIPDDPKPLPGLVSGQIILHGDPRQLDLLFGQGHISIEKSDLGNIAPLALLYEVLHVGAAPKQWNGRGSLDLSLQQSTLLLQNLRYFNRGIEAKAASISIGDVWKMPHCPVQGYLVGTARPLAGIKLPLIADADQILSVLQSNLTTVKIEGTIAKPEPKIAAFSDTGEELHRLLVGDARKESGN